MVGKMLKVQAIAKNVRQGMQEFFGIKTRREDWRYVPIDSRLPPSRVREVAVSTVAVGGRRFARYDYEQVRGARPRV